MTTVTTDTTGTTGTTIVTTPIGPLRLVAAAGALTRVDFLDEPVLSDGPPSDPTLVSAVAQLTEYFEGERTAFDLPLAPAGTPFQQKVWAALTRIPYGSTWTYGRLALEVGVPTAARAVGAANGRNPLAVVVPCHRVIGSDGTLTGYAGGLARKRTLLELEARAVAACR